MHVSLHWWQYCSVEIESTQTQNSIFFTFFEFFLFFLFFFLNRVLTEILPPPIKMPPSPTLSNPVISPETSLSHHSSPAKTSRIYYQPHHSLQHQVIDETVQSSKVPLSISTHHQLAAATASGIGTPGDYPHSSISGLSGIHSDVSLIFALNSLLRIFRKMFHCSSDGHINKFVRIRQQHKHHQRPVVVNII